VKRLKDILKIVIFASILLCSNKIEASELDSVEISLLTCAPGQEVYTAFGHTAIRVNDMREGGRDLAFNYGMFSFKKKFFVLRFIFGLTDYELGCYPTGLFFEDYAKHGRQVIEQVLNLTDEEKTALVNALWDNYKEENRTYRYNYFYDNCTSRARDIIEKNVQGRIDYHFDEERKTSYREMVHQYNVKSEWERFGEDLLLGVKADFKTDNRQQQFLPINLENDFSRATITGNDGTIRPLVAKANQVVPSGVSVLSKGFVFSPMECAIILLLCTLIITFADWKKKKASYWYDALLMLATGIAGIIITAMIFSQHPTVSFNLLIVILNPLPLFFIPMTIIRGRRKQYNPFFKWAFWGVLVFTAILTFIQKIPPAMIIVALCLLIRCMTEMLIVKKAQREK